MNIRNKVLRVLDKTGVPEATPYVGGTKDKYHKQHPTWAGQVRSFRSHALCGRGKTMSSSEQAICRNVPVGKERVSKAMPYIRGARQGDSASMHYMAASGWGKAGFSVTTSREGGLHMQSLAERHEGKRGEVIIHQHIALLKRRQFLNVCMYVKNKKKALRHL